jgi:hypothetical protein
MASILQIGQLLQEDVSFPRQNLFRVAAKDEDNDLVYLLPVDKKRPRGTRIPVEKCLSMVESLIGTRFRFVPECIRPPQMELTDDELPESAIRVRAQRALLLGEIVAPSNRLALVRKGSRAELIRKQAELVGVPETQIRLLVTTYIWYGCDEQALLGQTWAQGGKGRARKAGEKKRGRPNAFAVEDRCSSDKGVNVNDWHLQKFRQALRWFWIVQNRSLEETYNEMVQRLYVQKSKGTDGIVRTYPISNKKIPAPAQFRYWAKKIIAEEGSYKEKLGEKDWEDVHRHSHGSSSDLADKPGDVYDVDGTGGKGELAKTENRADRIGRPTLVIALDRGSNAIIGAAVSMHAEKWDLYRHCLFSAFTSKSSLLQSLGLPADCWPIHAVPAAIFVDRGPGNSRTAGDAIINRLKLDRATAPPRDPRAKGLAEGLNTTVHERLSHLRGAYTRAKFGARMIDKRKVARNAASYLRSEYFIELIKQVDIYNKTSDATHLLTARMRKDGVKPVPEEIFSWGIKNRRGGENLSLSDADILFKLLDRKLQVVHPRGVLHNKAYYWSPALDAWREAQMLEHHGETGFSPRVEVFADPVDPNVRYWELSPGVVDRLMIHEQGLARYEGATVEEVETEFVQEDRKNRIEKRRVRARGTVLRKEQKANLRDIAEVQNEQEAQKWLPPSRRPVSVSRREEQALEDSERARLSRTLMNHKAAPCESDRASSRAGDDVAIELDKNDMGATTPKQKEEARYADLFNKTFGVRVK